MVVFGAALVDDGPCQPVPATEAGVPGVQVERDDIPGDGVDHMSGECRPARLGPAIGGGQTHLSAVVGQAFVVVGVMGAGQESQRPPVGCQLVEVGGELDAANSDSVVVVPIRFVEVQDSFGALGQGGGAEELFG